MIAPCGILMKENRCLGLVKIYCLFGKKVVFKQYVVLNGKPLLFM